MSPKVANRVCGVRVQSERTFVFSNRIVEASLGPEYLALSKMSSPGVRIDDERARRQFVSPLQVARGSALRLSMTGK